MLRNAVHIGLVIHGPEIIDSGHILDVMRVLRELGPLDALIGGTMGRVAVRDMSLETVIDISRKLQTSEALNCFSYKDAIVLGNCGKTKETGEFFGQIVSAKVARTIIQVERPGLDDGCIICWAGEDGDHAEKVDKVTKYLRDKLGLALITNFKKALQIEKRGELCLRTLRGARRGENILINGIVTGTVTDDEVIIVSQGGRLIDIKGAQIKRHGFDKIARVDLKTAYIKSGSLRRSKQTITSSVPMRKTKLFRGKVVFVDHAAERVLEVIDEETVCVITIGDDTAKICGDILSRFNIPIIGITDGDVDGVYDCARHDPRSVIIEVSNTSDDEVGAALLRDALFDGKSHTLDEVKNTVLCFLRMRGVRFEVNGRAL